MASHYHLQQATHLTTLVSQAFFSPMLELTDEASLHLTFYTSSPVRDGETESSSNSAHFKIGWTQFEPRLSMCAAPQLPTFCPHFAECDRHATTSQSGRQLQASSRTRSHQSRHNEVHQGRGGGVFHERRPGGDEMDECGQAAHNECRRRRPGQHPCSVL